MARPHNWHHTTSRQERGYGAKWEKLRLQILARDQYLCQQCDREGRLTGLVTGNPRHPRAANVDHITPKAQGGTDDPDNLESLCRTCHNAKTASEQGWYTPRGCDAEGNPLCRPEHWRR